MSNRPSAVLTVAAGLVLALTACSDTNGPEAAAPPAAATATEAAAAPSAPAATATATKAAAVKADSVCPVSAAELLDAWAAHSGTEKEGTKMNKIVCYQGYAIGGYEPVGREGEVQTFQYKSGKWTYLTGGNGQYCEGVPAKVQKHFIEQGWSDCH